MGKLKTYAEWRLRENLREYDFYFRKFKNLLFNKFSFENLPNGISEYYIKKVLFENGFGIFFVNKYGFLQFAKATAIGMNDYDEPIGFHTVTSNQNNEFVKVNECVVIYNNELRTPSTFDVHYFSKKLSNIDKTIATNMEQLKNSLIISCPEGQRKTIEKLIAEREDCTPYIIVESGFSSYNEKIDFFNAKTENVCLQLEEEKKIVVAEALSFFGINNINIEKKERLITSEADSNNEEIKLGNDSMYKERKSAIDKVNEMFNCNIILSCNSVEWGNDTIE